MTHERDTDCTVDPETECCRECGVDHSNACETCGGRGFHRETCTSEYYIAEIMTDEMVTALRGEAAVHGDPEMVRVCDRALCGDPQAWLDCARVIGDARAARA